MWVGSNQYMVVDRYKDGSGAVKEYILADQNGQCRSLEPYQVKSYMAAGGSIKGLKLLSNGSIRLDKRGLGKRPVVLDLVDSLGYARRRELECYIVHDIVNALSSKGGTLDRYKCIKHDVAYADKIEVFRCKFRVRNPGLSGTDQLVTGSVTIDAISTGIVPGKVPDCLGAYDVTVELTLSNAFDGPSKYSRTTTVGLNSDLKEVLADTSEGLIDRIKQNNERYTLYGVKQMPGIGHDKRELVMVGGFDAVYSRSAKLRRKLHFGELRSKTGEPYDWLEIYRGDADTGTRIGIVNQ